MVKRIEGCCWEAIPASSNNITLIIQSATGAEITRVEFPKPLYRRIQRAAKARRCGLDGFFNTAMVAMLDDMDKSRRSK